MRKLTLLMSALPLWCVTHAHANSFQDCERGKNIAACELILKTLNENDSLEHLLLVRSARCTLVSSHGEIAAAKQYCDGTTSLLVAREHKGPRL